MNKLILFILVFTLTIFCAGCFKAQTINRELYVLNVPTTHKRAKTNLFAEIIKIDNAIIAPQFSNTSFVYRTTNINYLTDYYHAFFVPPAEMITQQVTHYLSKTNLFSQVISQDSYLSAQYILRPKILALYADYRNNSNPRGVMTIEFTLAKVKPVKKERILMNVTFSEAIPLRDKDSKSLVEAWNVGLRKILRRLEIPLRRIIKN